MRLSTLQRLRQTWADWHLPGGPVGPPARWAATSNGIGWSGTEGQAPGLLASTFTGARIPSYATAHGANLSHIRFVTDYFTEKR